MKNLIEFAQSAWSEEACKQIINMAVEQGLDRASTGMPGQYHINEVEQVRKCNTCWLVPEPRWKALFDEVEHMFRTANRLLYGYNIDHVPEIQFTEYLGSEGGKYDWHEDIFWADDTKEYHRKISMSVQLSNSFDYKGGDLEFKDIEGMDTDAMRFQGSAILFPSYLSHRVTPVTEGTRYSLVAWMEGPKFR